MKVKEFIAILQKKNQEADVFVGTRENNGCDTCGWGATTSEDDFELIDLETKIIIQAD
jgi:hypothetical protein